MLVPDNPFILKRCDCHTASREKQGYKWFGVETDIVLDGIIIPEFLGTRFPQYNGITGREEFIKKLIEFYKVKWKKEPFCVHGDLALCNVIFGDEVHIIDWEHFHLNKKEFFGFDIINMLFIHLQYEYRWFTYWGFNWVPFVSHRHKAFIKECIKMLGNVGFLRLPFTNSSWYIKKYMNKDKFILGKQSQEVIESLDTL